MPGAHTPLVIVLAHPDGSSDDGAVDPTHPLALRWARVAALGMQRESDGYPTGPGDVQLAERRAPAGHLPRGARAARTDGDRARGALVLRGRCRRRGRRARVARRRSVRRSHGPPAAGAGADWSEGRGTNAIGTAIAERAPVAVLGRAHYERRNGALFCYASPVFDARRTLVAVVDVSRPMEEARPGSGRGGAQCSRRRPERALRAVAFARAGVKKTSRPSSAWCTGRPRRRCSSSRASRCASATRPRVRRWRGPRAWPGGATRVGLPRWTRSTARGSSAWTSPR